MVSSDAGRVVPYVQLYFGSAPDRHPAAFDLLAGFGDDSELYYWRILGAVQIMHLYRTDRAALARLNTLQFADDAGGAVHDARARSDGQLRRSVPFRAINVASPR